jgi:AraC family transcriptional regulator, regulatory protein of adaptative response / DNA-3-methyladenine glycosylase II
VRLSFRPPLDAVALVGFFARRAVPGVEEVVDGAYRRSVRLPHGAGVVQVAPDMEAKLWLDDERDEEPAIAHCRALFDLDTDPGPIAEHLAADPVIGALVRQSPGRRVPGAVDSFEIAVRAVLGQQVSLAGAATLAGRLVREYGEPLRRPVGAVTHLFPTAEALARADPESLPMPASRRTALLGIARSGIALEPGAEPALLALPGIGPWTVSYIAMRALRDPDAFMPTDLGVRRALERLGHDASPRAAGEFAERWRPYRAYAMQHLWAALS